MKANFRELGQETWFMIQQNIKTLLYESSTYLRFWIGFHEQPSYVSPHIRPSCAIPSSGSSRPLLSYVSPLLVPFSPSSFLRSPGWLPAHVSSLLVRSLRVLWRSCYPQLPPTGHRLHAASLLIYTFWLDLTMEREQMLVIMLILFRSWIID